MSSLPYKFASTVIAIMVTSLKASFYSKLFLKNLEVWRSPAALLKEKVKPVSSTSSEGYTAERVSGRSAPRAPSHQQIPTLWERHQNPQEKFLCD